jgi:predicted DCC family thiol-disulfide oxidoreductase YuxK
MEPAPLIVLIDGDCALCNGTAQWFAARDRFGGMIFAANTGEVARILGEPPGGDSRTVVVWSGSRRLVRSAAVFALLRQLGGGWSVVAQALAWVPVCLADRLYDCIASRRSWWGRPATCVLLKPWHSAD